MFKHAIPILKIGEHNKLKLLGQLKKDLLFYRVVLIRASFLITSWIHYTLQVAFSISCWFLTYWWQWAKRVAQLV